MSYILIPKYLLVKRLYLSRDWLLLSFWLESYGASENPSGNWGKANFACVFTSNEINYFANFHHLISTA